MKKLFLLGPMMVILLFSIFFSFKSFISTPAQNEYVQQEYVPQEYVPNEVSPEANLHRGKAPAQTIIENPATPLTKNAGRVLKLREVWRIADEGGAFYFKSPHNLQIAEDGSIFIADQEQLLRFNKDGKFLMNFFKKGQGPGEISDAFTFLIDKNELYVKDYRQMRIFRMDSDGRYIDQLSLKIGSLNLFGVRSDGYVMMKPVWPSREEQKVGFYLRGI